MAISRNMLSMSVTAEAVTGRTADRKPVYGEAVELKNVWFDKATAQNNGAYGNAPADSGVLFYDCALSTPKDFNFSKDMKITWENESFLVYEIKKCVGRSGNVEHIEIRVK